MDWKTEIISRLDKTTFVKRLREDFRLSTKRIKKSVKEKLEFPVCLFCDKTELQNSHVIKKQTLKNMKCKSFFTLAGKTRMIQSPLTEDEMYTTVAKAFTFKLVCNSCDKFSYEDKCRSKEKYTQEDLKGIALKSRLKELYDNFERYLCLSYKAENVFDKIVLGTLGSAPNLVLNTINDEARAIKKIRNANIKYAVVADHFLDFRVPFATEFFAAPTRMPESRIKIGNNLVPLKGAPKNSDMSTFYTLIQPGGDANDNWTRVTVFFEEDDPNMRHWFNEFNTNVSNLEDLVNKLISYHFSSSSKNFVMSSDINKEFLEKALQARYKTRERKRIIKEDWLKLSMKKG